MEKRFIDELRGANEKFEELNEHELKLIGEIKAAIRKEVNAKGLVGTRVKRKFEISDEESQYINSAKITNHMRNKEGLENFVCGLEAIPLMAAMSPDFFIYGVKAITFKIYFSVNF